MMDTSDSVVGAGFDALPAHVAILDDDGAIVYTNRSWTAFGDEQGLADSAAAVGVNYLEVCDASRGDDAANAARGIRAIIAGRRETFSYEYPCHTPSEKHWFTMETAAYRHNGDRYILVMHVEITERRRLEQQAREQAEQMEAFARLLSHDLRNPLSVALATAQSLKSTDAGLEDETDAETDWAALRSSLERMEAIIDDALMLVTTEDAEQLEPVRLSAAAENAWSHVQTEAATLSVTDSVTVEADPNRLQHLLENVFRNAVEHGGQTPTIEVGTLEAAAEGQSFVDGFYIQDDGPGIPPTDRENIFESGYTTEAAGSGFGLAIVNRVVDAHGWSIAVTDADSSGARFEIRSVTTLE